MYLFMKLFDHISKKMQTLAGSGKIIPIRIRPTKDRKVPFTECTNCGILVALKQDETHSLFTPSPSVRLAPISNKARCLPGREMLQHLRSSQARRGDPLAVHPSTPLLDSLTSLISLATNLARKCCGILVALQPDETHSLFTPLPLC
jgi:hypothetical protein